MLGWPLILMTWLAWVLLASARRNSVRYWAGITTVFLFGWFGGVELWVALAVNAVQQVLL